MGRVFGCLCATLYLTLLCRSASLSLGQVRKNSSAEDIALNGLLDGVNVYLGSQPVNNTLLTSLLNMLRKLASKNSYLENNCKIQSSTACDCGRTTTDKGETTEALTTRTNTSSTSAVTTTTTTTSYSGGVSNRVAIATTATSSGGTVELETTAKPEVTWSVVTGSPDIPTEMVPQEPENTAPPLSGCKSGRNWGSCGGRSGGISSSNESTTSNEGVADSSSKSGNVADCENALLTASGGDVLDEKTREACIPKPAAGKNSAEIEIFAQKLETVPPPLSSSSSSPSSTFPQETSSGDRENVSSTTDKEKPTASCLTLSTTTTTPSPLYLWKCNIYQARKPEPRQGATVSPEDQFFDYLKSISATFPQIAKNA